MFAIGRCHIAVQGAVQCSGSCLPLGGVRVLSTILSGCCSGVLLRGAVEGAPDHVCHGAVQGAVQRCCPGCSGSRLLLGGGLRLGGVRVLSRVLCRVPSRVLRIMFAIGSAKNCSGCSGSCLPSGGQGAVQGAVQGAPDHVCHCAVSACSPAWCPECSGSCLPLGGVRVLSRVLRIMFAFGRCQGAVQGAVGAVRVLRIMSAIGRCQGAVQGAGGAVQGAPDHVCHWGVSVLSQGAVQGAPDHVCHWAVSGCCGVLSKVLRIMFAMVLSRVLSSGAVQGVSDHVCYWAVSGCCSGCC